MLVFILNGFQTQRMKACNYNLREATARCTLNEGLVPNTPAPFRKSVIKGFVSYSQRWKVQYLSWLQPHTVPWDFPVWTCFCLLLSNDASAHNWPFFLETSSSFFSFPFLPQLSQVPPFLPLVFSEYQLWLIHVIIPLGPCHSL